MNKMKVYVCCMMNIMICIIPTYAQKDESNDALMTARDMQKDADTLSNITITNRTNEAITSAGLFISSFDTNDCSACSGAVALGDDLGGAVVSLVTFNPNQPAPIGQNYLYNMIYNGLYYVRTIVSAPCLLPGCSWPGDDTTVKGWCVSINAISRHSNYTFSHYTNGSNPPANTPAYADAGNAPAFHYKYDLIDPSTLGVGNACLGPIVCDDKTLTCKVKNAQNESIQAY